MDVYDFWTGEVILFGVSILVCALFDGVHLFLVEDKDGITLLISARICDPYMVSFVLSGFLKKLPLSIADFEGIPQQKGTDFFGGLKLHLMNLVGRIWCSIGNILMRPPLPLDRLPPNKLAFRNLNLSHFFPNIRILIIYIRLKQNTQLCTNIEIQFPVNFGIIFLSQKPHKIM